MFMGENMTRLIAIDSDGTLRHSDGTISKRIKCIVKKMVNNDVITVCTARPRYHTEKVSNELGANDYFISSNGSEIYDNKQKKIVWACYLKSSHCIQIYEYANKNDIRIMFVLDNTEYVTQFTRNEDQVLLDDNNLTAVLNGNVKQIMVIGDNREAINNFKDVVINDFKLNVTDSSDTTKEEIWFSIISNEASKGIAVLKLADYLNISRSEIIAIGNDKNDISMLDIAFVGVAVANATSQTKEHANVLVDSNDDDGVANFLESIYENND